MGYNKKKLEKHFKEDVGDDVKTTSIMPENDIFNNIYSNLFTIYMESF